MPQTFVIRRQREPQGDEPNLGDTAWNRRVIDEAERKPVAREPGVNIFFACTVTANPT